MYNSYYGLTFNPFDKQQLKENDHFISRDFTEMTNRLNYLKDIRGIGVFTARPGMGKSFCLPFKQGYDNMRSARRESAASPGTAQSGR